MTRWISIKDMHGKPLTLKCMSARRDQFDTVTVLSDGACIYVCEAEDREMAHLDALAAFFGPQQLRLFGVES